MNILDDMKKIKRLDRQNVLGSIDALPEQIRHAWRESRKVKFPARYKKAKKVVVAGMGGSIIGAHLIESVFAKSLKVPFVRLGDYHLPAWVGRDTLVILSSYSGTTEEILVMGKEALKRGCMVAGITAGGTLGRMMKSRKLPWYNIIPTYNPSNQPRMATGYSVFGLLGMLNRLGITRLENDAITQSIGGLQVGRRRWGAHVTAKNNLAKTIASVLANKYILFIAAEHLVGNVHIAANQFNENAKQFATYFSLPELNHHLLEGLKFPKDNRRLLTAVLFESQLYHTRNQKRVSATVRIFQQQGIRSIMIPVRGATTIEQAMQVAQLGAYIGYYLAMLNHLDPAPIRWVDEFKRIMAHP